MQKIQHVTLIEDDPISEMITKKMLSKISNIKTIDCYPNGKAAYEGFLAKENQSAFRTDLILLDLFMPIWDGWDFLAEFRKLERFQSVPLYILTSSASKEDLSRARALGLENAYIPKPISIEKISSILKAESFRISKMYTESDNQI